MNSSRITVSKTAKWKSIAAAAMVALSAAALRADTVDLGSAGNFAVLTTGQMSFNGPGLINGNVGVGQGVNFAMPAQINGSLYEAPGVTGGSNIVPTGGTFTNFNLAPAIQAAQNAAVSANSLTATQNLGAVGNNTTINGNGGKNVVDVSNIALSNGVLTLHGSASDSFVINDSGAFTFSNSGVVLVGGVTASNVLFNVAKDVTLTGGGNANFSGTILAPNSNVSVHDKTLTGELIGRTIADTSGFTVNRPTSVPLPAPFAACGALLGLGLLGALTRKKAAFSI